MAEIVSQGQGAFGRRHRLIEAFLVIVAAGVVVIAIAWAAAGSGARVVPLEPTQTQYLQAPGLLEQRAGERSGGTRLALDPGLQEQRSGERAGN